MIFVTRSTCRLRPCGRTPVHIDKHPGMVIHCTGGMRPTSRTHALQRWRIAQVSHMDGNGWADIGYHFAVTPDGEVLEGRGWGVRGAHAAKYNRWLGVVLFGVGEEMSEGEKAGINTVHAELVVRGGGSAVIPHNAISRKRCPGPAVTAWIDERFGRQAP